MVTMPLTPPMAPEHFALPDVDLDTPFIYQPQFKNRALFESPARNSIADNEEDSSTGATEPARENVTIPVFWLSLVLDPSERELAFIALLSAAQLLHDGTRKFLSHPPSTIEREQQCTVLVALARFACPWTPEDKSRAAGPRIEHIWTNVKTQYAQQYQQPEVFAEQRIQIAISELRYDLRAQEVARYIVEGLEERGIQPDQGATGEFWMQVLKPILMPVDTDSATRIDSAASPSKSQSDEASASTTCSVPIDEIGDDADCEDGVSLDDDDNGCEAVIDLLGQATECVAESTPTKSKSDNGGGVKSRPVRATRAGVDYCIRHHPAFLPIGKLKRGRTDGKMEVGRKQRKTMRDDVRLNTEIVRP